MNHSFKCRFQTYFCLNIGQGYLSKNDSLRRKEKANFFLCRHNFFHQLLVFLLLSSQAGAAVAHKMEWALASCVIYALTLLSASKKVEIITNCHQSLVENLKKMSNSHTAIIGLRLSIDFIQFEGKCLSWEQPIIVAVFKG